MLPLLLAGGAMAAMSGKGGFFGPKEGQNAGNAFEPLKGDAQQSISSYLNRDAQTAGNEIMADPRLGNYFGKGWNDLNKEVGTLGQEEREQATKGFNLNEQDNTALGQASGNIARQFGQRDAALSQALASRGLGRSGGAANAIANAQGSKSEQLAQIQTNIAQQRIQNNMQRLNSTRQFMNQMMGQQAQRAGQYEGAINDRNAFAQSKAAMGENTLSNFQNQANNQFQQTQATASGGLGGALRKGMLGAVEAAPGQMMGMLTGGGSGGGQQGSAGGHGTEMNNGGGMGANQMGGMGGITKMMGIP